MKQILIVFYCDNGYTCSCCRQDWQETEHYIINEDSTVEEFINKIKKETNDEYSRREYGRRDIDSAYIVSEQII